MRDTLDKQVEQLLLAGEGKAAILKRLADGTNRVRLLGLLNNKVTLARRRQYMWINLTLCGVLLLMTVRRLLAISAAGHLDFYLLADFIVPTINFYLLRETLRFHRNGYFFLAVLTGLGLVYPMNRLLPDLLLHLFIIITAIFLHRQLFPKQEILRDPKGS